MSDLNLSPTHRSLHEPFRLFLAFLVAFFLPLLASAQGWDVVKLNGQDYVPLDSIRKFYGFTGMKQDGKNIVLESKAVHMELTAGANECTMNGVKFVFSYPVETSANRSFVSRIDLCKLVDPVLRPNYIQGSGNFNTVILDAGHGGNDPGATNAYGTEAAYTFKLASRAKALLEARGFKVVLTRTSDRFYSLQERVNIANRVQGNAIFISLHFNSGGSQARGIETFTLSPVGVTHYGRELNASDFNAKCGNAQDSANIALATAVHGCALRRLGQNTFDRGIKRARFSVLSGVRHPAILFEGGFVSHPYEARLIQNDQYQNALANSIADAVVKYRFAVSRANGVNS